MSGSHTDRRERAFALLARLNPLAPTRVAASLDALSPELAELVLGFAFADVLARPGINLCTREMLTVATLMGMGTAPDSSSSISGPPSMWGSAGDHHRDLLQVAVYAGVPACMNGISAARSAFAAHDKGRGQGLRRRRHPGEKVRCALTRAARREPRLPSFMVLAGSSPFWQRTAYPRLELGEHDPGQDEAAPSR